MGNGGQIRADFSTLEQLSSDQSSTAGNVDDLRSQLQGHVSQALGQLDGGMGSEEHQACMNKANQMIEEHVQGLRTFQSSTQNVNETFQGAGRNAQNMLASGA